MATYHSSSGVVKSGSNTVGEIVSMSIDESFDTAEDTVIGDSSKTYSTSGLSEWSGSLVMRWDPDDSGQGDLTVGASITIHFGPEGGTSGDTDYTGSAIITGLSRSQGVNDIVEFSVNFVGNGALSASTF